eukprot:gb/GEZN01023108.1/.p1 GENE.gb/GEZN01023108.1/~~gb/GEZN01023108.1/.p1  ORF type:complete len:198 (-),score=23.36 gb/GEZN01023108.1/:8-601(-)
MPSKQRRKKKQSGSRVGSSAVSTAVQDQSGLHYQHQAESNFLVATQDLPAGTCIYRETPYLVAAKTKSTCLACNKTHPAEKSCLLLKKRFGPVLPVLPKVGVIAKQAQVSETLLMAVVQSIVNATVPKQRDLLQAALVLPAKAPISPAERKQISDATSLLREILPVSLQVFLTLCKIPYLVFFFFFVCFFIVDIFNI